MVTAKKQYLIRFSTLTLIATLLVSCAQYGIISENDVYIQKPTALSTNDDESDLTSYNAYKARERGEYQDEYLIDQMHDRRLIGTLLYGNQSMFFMPFTTSSYIPWGYHSPILAYQNTHYFNSFYNWNRPWTYNYGYGYGGYAYNPYNNGYFGYGYSPFFHNHNNYSGQSVLINNTNVNASQNYYTGKPRVTLSSNSSRSSSYPSTLKSAGYQQNSDPLINDQTQGSSRRVSGRKTTVRSSHMPFKEEDYNKIEGSNNGNMMNSSRNNSSRSYNSTERNRYTPSQSAKRNGIARSTRSTVGGSTNRSNTQQVYRGSSNQPRSTNYSTRTRSSQSTGARSVGGSSSRSSGSSSSSSSRRQ
jgi:hypothetical protein